MRIVGPVAGSSIYRCVACSVMSTRLLEKVVEEFYANNGFELCSDVVLQLDRAINQGALVKRLLNEIADELDKWHRNSSIVKVAGSSTGIGGAIAGVGGSIAAAGVVLCPLTVGTSAVIGVVVGGVVAGVGGAVALAGTGTVVGTQIANKCHNNSLLKRAQEAIDEYSGYRNNIVEAWKKVENMCHTISIKVKSFGVEAILDFVWQTFLNAKDCIDVEEITKKSAPLAKRLPVPVCIGLCAFVVGTGACAYNVYELVISAKVIHKKEPHPAAVEIRNKAIVEVDIEMEKLQTVKTSLENKCVS